MISRDSDPRGVWRLVVWGVLASLLVAAISLRPPSLLGYVDQRIYDVLLRSAHRAAVTGRVAIVDLDDRTLAKFGRWPWPRERLAQLLAKIQRLGVVSVGLDMVFPEPDETPSSSAEPAARKSPDGEFTLTPHDAALAAVLARGPFVLGFGLGFGADREARVPCVLHPLRLAYVRQSAGSNQVPLFQAWPRLCSLPGLARAAPGSGFLNAAPDRDGILRRMPLVIADEEAVYPSLGLATVIMAFGIRRVVLRTNDVGAESLALDDLVVPLDAKGGFLLAYRGGKGTIPYVSAADVLDDRVTPTALRDRLVFVGVTALGIRDTVVTPLDATYPGVELHATVADSILRGEFLSRPRAAPAVELLLTLLAGPIAALVVVVAGVTWGAAILGALGVGLWLGAGWLLGAKGIFLSPLYPLAGLAVSFTALTVASVLLERGRADWTAWRLRQTRELLLHSLTSLTGTRDHETGTHLLRTQQYMQVLCEELAHHPRFREFLTPDTIDLVARLAPIHDIGKVGVPDIVLRKPGPLTDEEWEQMRRHPEFGHQVIADAERRAGIRHDVLLRLAKDVVSTHHERWDGTGYPKGLKGEAIPIAGRLVAVVDVYDALVSKRVYKEALPHEVAVRMIVEKRGTHFDPDIVDAVVRVETEWRRISESLGDGATDSMHP
ncbi:MAG TPA: CHASE2 domain-containing protein [Candidatus Methylomirabilis sp.]|nr:CHASE2 domain-containing protein [Candidatus Methylomirabilis sp.]